MAATFCFRCVRENGNYSGQFDSLGGERYIVKFHVGNAHGSVGGQLALEWAGPSCRHVRVSSYSEANGLLLCKSIYVKDGVGASMVLPANSYVIVVSVAPSVSLSKNVPLPAKVDGENLIPTEKEPVVEERLEQLSADMRKLLDTGCLSDVVLTDGTELIQAHSAILSARSSVFAKMLQHPMKESQENRIDIKDIAIEVLQELLHFIYTGTAKIKDLKMARELYIAADKYDVKDLRDIASTKLRSLNLNNVLDALLLADLYSDMELKEAALQFISRNYLQLKALQEWNDFITENETLAIETLCFVLDRKI